jgi:hypothetical protein
MFASSNISILLSFKKSEYLNNLLFIKYILKIILIFAIMYYRLNGRETEHVGGMKEMIDASLPITTRLFSTEIGQSRISTVFLSMDHGLAGLIGDGSPVLFETMVFGGEHDEYQERYHTYDEAEEGHKRIVEMVDKISIERERKLKDLGIDEEERYI